MSEIANATCISARYLHAIEADDVKQLPGEFFYKAFLRQYAKALDLDEGTTNRILASAVPVEEPDPVPALSHAYIQSEGARPSRWTLPTGVAVGLFLAVLAGGSGLYAWYQNVQSRKEAVTQEASAQTEREPPVAPAATSAPAVEDRPKASDNGSTDTKATDADTRPTDPAVSEPVETAATAAVPANPPVAPVTPSLVPEAVASISLEVSSTEPTWVSLSSGGKTAFSGTLQPAEPRQFSVASGAKLHVGNAGAIQVRMNGKSLGDIGPRGQVRTVLFTPGNFQILQPKLKVSSSGEGTTTTAGVALRTTPRDR